MSTQRLAALTFAGLVALSGCDAQLANQIESDPKASSSPSPSPTPTPEPLVQGIQLTLVASGSTNAPDNFVPATGSLAVSSRNALSVNLSQSFQAKLQGAEDDLVQLSFFSPEGPALVEGMEWEASASTGHLTHRFVEMTLGEGPLGPFYGPNTIQRIWTLGKGRVRLDRISGDMVRVVFTDLVPTAHSGSAQGEFTLNATATLPIKAR